MMALPYRIIPPQLDRRGLVFREKWEAGVTGDWSAFYTSFCDKS
jgi:hypothetical protein